MNTKSPTSAAADDRQDQWEATFFSPNGAEIDRKQAVQRPPAKPKAASPEAVRAPEPEIL